MVNDDVQVDEVDDVELHDAIELLEIGDMQNLFNNKKDSIKESFLNLYLFFILHKSFFGLMIIYYLRIL